MTAPRTGVTTPGRTKRDGMSKSQGDSENVVMTEREKERALERENESVKE